MAAVCVGVLRTQTVVGVADEGGRRGGGHESLAGDGVYPVGCTGASGKIVRDGLRIGCVLSHQAKERQDGGPRVAEAFIDELTVTPFSLLISELALSQLNRSPSSPTCFQRGHPFSFSHLPFHSPWMHPARCIMHHGHM
jgi:hypothetical protein